MTDSARKLRMSLAGIHEPLVNSRALPDVQLLPFSFPKGRDDPTSPSASRRSVPPAAHRCLRFPEHRPHLHRHSSCRSPVDVRVWRGDHAVPLTVGRPRSALRTPPPRVSHSHPHSPTTPHEPLPPPP